MTFEQLTIFVAVAERQHLTRAAEAIGLTPSAVSSAIKALETFYNVRLFERVGRGIALTQAGGLFLDEARATLARARAAELVLSELGGLKRGTMNIHASQTIANYWLPSRLMNFHRSYPDIEIRLTVGNTRTVTQAVVAGEAELGFVEGVVDVAAVAVKEIDTDELVAVARNDHPMAGRSMSPAEVLDDTLWVMREPGSGTRSEFEAAIRAMGRDPFGLKIALALPSNEAVLSAVIAGQCAAALSKWVVEPLLSSGRLVQLPIVLGQRSFSYLRHREKNLSSVARELIRLLP